jgi:hypothetical protein
MAMHRRLWQVLAFLVSVRTGAPSDLAAQFQTLETRDMRLVYTSPMQAYLVPQVARSFENALQFHSRLFDYTPDGKINVLVHDLWHHGNAGARPVPENHITVGIAPYAHDYESAPGAERMASSFNHEMAHIVTMDKATSSDRFFRSVFFGKVTPNAEVPLSMLYGYLTTPRWFSPRWYLEGIAVYLETWMNGGLGRVIGPYDEMVFRTLVRDSGRIYDVVGLESEGTTIDFQVGMNSYLYGTRFMSYLALHYGNDSLLAWVDRTQGSRAYFATQFQHVYGRPLAEEWSRWVVWEREWQQANLTAIRRHPTTDARPLTDRAMGSVSRAYYDAASGSLYVAVFYPGQDAYIAAIEVASGRIRRLGSIAGATGFHVTALAFDPGSRTLFYTTNNAEWRHLAALDLATGRSRILLRDARVGDLAFNPADGSLWGVRHDNGFSTLVRLPAPYDQWHQVTTLPYGRDLFDLDVSPDGRTLVGSMSEISGLQRLARMDIAALLAGDDTPEILYEFGDWSPSTFVFSADGRYLFGSSYYSGVSNIFRYDLTREVMEPLSNAETGFFKPVPLSEDSVLVFAYSARGFVPSMIPNAVPDSVSAIRFLGNEIAATRTEVQDWMPPPSSLINLDSLTVATGTYRSLSHFKLDNVYPVVEGYRDAAGSYAVAGGVRLNFSDRIGTTSFDLTSSWSPGQDIAADEQVHLRAVFRHWSWRISAAYNPADFYDLFGPTTTSRKGYGLGLQYSGNLIYDVPRTLGYTVQVAGYGGLATLPEYQDVAAPYETLLSGSGNLAYSSLRASLGAIEHELGTTWGVTVRGNYAAGDLYTRVNVDVAQGMLLPLNHSSLWFRASVGSAVSGDRDNPFANFYFGGFGNNWVDHRSIRQFRGVESFPGLDINAVGGATYGRIQGEWTLPPLRFRRAGTPSFYLRWAGLTFFATGLLTDLDASDTRRGLGSVGGQLDFRLVTLSHLNSTLSFGYAWAWGQDLSPTDAFMFSFKIM